MPYKHTPLHYSPGIAWQFYHYRSSVRNMGNLNLIIHNRNCLSYHLIDIIRIHQRSRLPLSTIT